MSQKNIYAVTEQCIYPAFVSLNDNGGTNVLTVRSRGEGSTTGRVASMVLTDDEMAHLAEAIAAHLKAKAA